jgi:uncharacterized protein (UPF0248 family)
MIPIHELLNRIRWDPEFGAARFEIGYYDRAEDRILRVGLDQVRFAADDHFAVDVAEEDAEIHTVPLHRIKEVYRNGELIWHREH